MIMADILHSDSQSQHWSWKTSSETSTVQQVGAQHPKQPQKSPVPSLRLPQTLLMHVLLPPVQGNPCADVSSLGDVPGTSLSKQRPVSADPYCNFFPFSVRHELLGGGLGWASHPSLLHRGTINCIPMPLPRSGWARLQKPLRRRCDDSWVPCSHTSLLSHLESFASPELSCHILFPFHLLWINKP